MAWVRVIVRRRVFQQCEAVFVFFVVVLFLFFSLCLYLFWNGNFFLHFFLTLCISFFLLFFVVHARLRPQFCLVVLVLGVSSMCGD